jgi:hypothetical protein
MKFSLNQFLIIAFFTCTVIFELMFDLEDFG